LVTVENKGNMVKIKYPKYYKDLSINDLKNKCLEIFDTKLKGKKVINSNSGAIIKLSKKGAKHALFARGAGFNKVLCVSKIDQILRHGKMYSIERSKSKGVLFVIKFLTEVSVDSENMYVITFIRSTNSGEMYYDHAVIEQKKPQDYRNGFL